MARDTTERDMFARRGVWAMTRDPDWEAREAKAEYDAWLQSGNGEVHMLLRDAVYEEVRELAALRQPMQTNKAIAAKLGGDADHHKVAHALKMLVAHGLITVEYRPDGQQRRIHIIADASRTEYQAARGAVTPTRGPKMGQRSPFAKASYGIDDATLYGRYADAVRRVRQRGYVVTRAGSEAFRVDHAVVTGERLMEMAR